MLRNEGKETVRFKEQAQVQKGSHKLSVCCSLALCPLRSSGLHLCTAGFGDFRAATAETLCLVVDPRLQESLGVVSILFLHSTESTAQQLLQTSTQAGNRWDSVKCKGQEKVVRRAENSWEVGTTNDQKKAAEKHCIYKNITEMMTIDTLHLQLDTAVISRQSFWKTKISKSVLVMQEPLWFSNLSYIDSCIRKQVSFQDPVLYQS